MTAYCDSENSLRLLQDFLPTGLAAKELGVTRTCVRSLCERGGLPGACQPWGPEFGWLIPRQAVAARKQAKKRGRLPGGGNPKTSKLTQVVAAKALAKTG